MSDGGSNKFRESSDGSRLIDESSRGRLNRAGNPTRARAQSLEGLGSRLNQASCPMATLRLIAQQFHHPVDDIRRLRDYFFRQLRQLLAADRIHSPPPLFQVFQQRGIFERPMVGVAQDFHPIGRHAGRRHHRPAEDRGSEEHRGHPPGRLRRLVLVHQFIDRRNISNQRISFFPRLQDRPDKAFLVPGQKRLAGKVGADRQIAAVQLAALDAEVDLAAAGIAGRRC